MDGLIFVVAVHGSIITACGWNPLLSLMIRFWLFHKNYLCLFLFTCGSDLNPLMMYASGFGCFFYMFFIIFGMWCWILFYSFCLDFVLTAPVLVLVLPLFSLACFTSVSLCLTLRSSFLLRWTHPSLVRFLLPISVICEDHNYITCSLIFFILFNCGPF